ncbi:MAG: hypothetical protein K2H97_03275 [Prevotella sp.]|nr:hypothetical protein [Prevotella sp.]
MNKIFSKLMMLMAVTLFVSCSEDEGTDVGTDSAPAVTLYQYTPDAPYNADNDVKLRMAVNNKVESLYYLVEKAADKAAMLEEADERAYAEYVIKEGKKVELTAGELHADMIVTGLVGEYTITAVAVNGNARSWASTTFIGYNWVKVTDAISMMNIFTGEEIATELQYASNVDLYRFVDPWGTGVAIAFKWDGGKGVTFTNSSIATGWSHPNYGLVTFAPSSSKSAYFAQYNAFQFVGTWTVAAGSFGENAGVIYLSEIPEIN